MVAPRAWRLEFKCLLIPPTSFPITTHTNHPEFQPQPWASQTHTSEPFAHKCSCLQIVIMPLLYQIPSILGHVSFISSPPTFPLVNLALATLICFVLFELATLSPDLLEDILAWSLGLSFMHSASVTQPAAATAQLCLQLLPSCLFIILREIANFKAFPEQTI